MSRKGKKTFIDASSAFILQYQAHHMKDIQKSWNCSM